MDIEGLFTFFKEEQQRTNQFNTVPLSQLLQKIYFNQKYFLKQHLEASPTNDQWLHFLYRTRKQFIRFLILIKYLNQHPVPLYTAILKFQKWEMQKLFQVADGLFYLSNKVEGLPKSALEMSELCLTQQYEKLLPLKCQYYPKETKIEFSQHLQSQLEEEIRRQFLSESFLKWNRPEYVEFQIGSGMLKMSAKHAFDLYLSLRADETGFFWICLKLDLFLFPSLDQRLKKQLLNIIQHQLTASTSTTNDSADSTNTIFPLEKVFDFLHNFCLSTVLDLLYEQSLKLKLKTSFANESLTITYWQTETVSISVDTQKQQLKVCSRQNEDILYLDLDSDLSIHIILQNVKKRHALSILSHVYQLLQDNAIDCQLSELNLNVKMNQEIELQLRMDEQNGRFICFMPFVGYLPQTHKFLSRFNNGKENKAQVLKEWKLELLLERVEVLLQRDLPILPFQPTLPILSFEKGAICGQHDRDFNSIRDWQCFKWFKLRYSTNTNWLLLCTFTQQYPNSCFLWLSHQSEIRLLTRVEAELMTNQEIKYLLNRAKSFILQQEMESEMLTFGIHIYPLILESDAIGKELNASGGWKVNMKHYEDFGFMKKCHLYLLSNQQMILVADLLTLNRNSFIFEFQTKIFIGQSIHDINEQLELAYRWFQFIDGVTDLSEIDKKRLVLQEDLFYIIVSEEKQVHGSFKNHEIHLSYHMTSLMDKLIDPEEERWLQLLIHQIKESRGLVFLLHLILWREQLTKWSRQLPFNNHLLYTQNPNQIQLYIPLPNKEWTVIKHPSAQQQSKTKHLYYFRLEFGLEFDLSGQFVYYIRDLSQCSFDPNHTFQTSTALQTLEECVKVPILPVILNQLNLSPSSTTTVMMIQFPNVFCCSHLEKVLEKLERWLNGCLLICSIIDWFMDSTTFQYKLDFSFAPVIFFLYHSVQVQIGLLPPTSTTTTTSTNTTSGNTINNTTNATSTNSNTNTSTNELNWKVQMGASAGSKYLHYDFRKESERWMGVLNHATNINRAMEELIAGFKQVFK